LGFKPENHKFKRKKEANLAYFARDILKIYKNPRRRYQPTYPHKYRAKA